jgi:hypothetical protein
MCVNYHISDLIDDNNNKIKRVKRKGNKNERAQHNQEYYTPRSDKRAQSVTKNMESLIEIFCI